MRKKIHFALLMTMLSTLIVLQSAYAYENTEYGFSIDPPAGWNPLEPDEEEIIVGWSDPNVAVTGAFFNVVIHDTDLSLSAYVEEWKQSEVDKYGTGAYVLESEGSRTVGGLESYELVSTHTHEGMGALKNKQAIFVGNGKGFVVNCGTYSSEFDNFLGAFDQTIDSFRIDSSDDNGQDLTGVIVAVVAVVVIGVIVGILFLRNKQKP